MLILMIPVNEPILGEEELANVRECVETDWVSSQGRFVGEFEEAWSSKCQREHGIAVANGTAALEVAVRALDLDEGDEVIMPSFTIISCAAAVVRAGARPVLVDVDPDTWAMDVDQCDEKVTDRTRALLPVHMYGHPVDMKPLLDIAEHYDLKIIEDAAEAHGAECDVGPNRGDTRPCGSFGDLSTFSFYANKLITTGEGGMVVTDDPELAARCRKLRNLCFEEDRRFLHRELGFNYRMTNLQAAVGFAQTDRIESIVDQKRAMAHRYEHQLADIPYLQLPTERSWARNVYWMYGIVLADDAPVSNAEALASRLEEHGIETRPFFLGMHEQPVFRERGLFGDESYPVTEKISRQGLYLPSGLALTKDQQQDVCETVRDLLG